jgi:steroid 5-alpha reductase family enzyme
MAKKSFLSLSDLPGDRFLACYGQAPRRRKVLFRGVWRFSTHFCYFSFVLFGGNGIFCKFACERVVILSSIPDK